MLFYFLITKEKVKFNYSFSKYTVNPYGEKDQLIVHLNFAING